MEGNCGVPRVLWISNLNPQVDFVQDSGAQIGCGLWGMEMVGWFPG